MRSLTERSNRIWLLENDLKVQRYLRRYHHTHDRNSVWGMIMSYPDEGRKLIENFDLSNDEKLIMICAYMIMSDQLSCIIVGDQRMGKDATACFFLEACIKLLEKTDRKWRVVTLGNIKKPPFVADKDMFFAFNHLPWASGEDWVVVYCSELEVQFPAREPNNPDSRVFAQTEGTMAQNHQKLIGAVKLMAKVDLNVIRGANMKMFKFISPDKLSVEGIERDGVLTGLGRMLLPRDREDKSEVLVCFNDNLFTVHTQLPEWWTTEYSEMFAGISDEMIWEYIEQQFYGNNIKPEQIAGMVNQKFRRTDFTRAKIAERLGRDTTTRKVQL